MGNAAIGETCTFDVLHDKESVLLTGTSVQHQAGVYLA